MSAEQRLAELERRADAFAVDLLEAEQLLDHVMVLLAARLDRLQQGRTS